MMQTICGDKALRHSSVPIMFKQFKYGREDLQDDARNVSPSISQNADTIANVP
jgi:hypothetical protein